MATVGIEPVGDLMSEQLLAVEASQMMISPGIASITWFKGDAAKATAVLKERLRALVEANPWLAGTLTKSSGPLSLTYSRKPSAEWLEELFNPTLVKGKACKKPIMIDTTMSWEQLCRAVSKTAAEVCTGNAAKNKGFPLLALSIVPDSKTPDTAFAVILSASHVILDGFNYYQVMSMLSSGGEIKALNVARKHEIKHENQVASGVEETKFALSGAVMCNVVCGMLCGKKPVISNFYLDAAKVSQTKQDAASAGGVDFVSTNDVLLSKFGGAVGARVMLMPIGWRGKLPLLSKDADVGNYEGCLVFTPDDYAHPALVRKTLKSGPPTWLRGGGGEMTPPAPLPAGCAAMYCRLGMITNWTFDHFTELAIDGCEHLLHVPYCDCAMVPFEWAVVYRPRAGQLAVAMFTRACGSERLMAELPLAQAVRVE